MSRPEQNLQAACWVYARDVLPEDADFASIETKTGRSDMMAAVWRKQAGIRAGQPDCQITYRGRVTYVELKAGATVSDAQRKRHAELRRAGAEVYVVRSIVELARVFGAMAIPLRYHALDPATRDAMLAARAAKPPKRTARRPGELKPSRKALDIARRAQLWGTGE